MDMERKNDAAADATDAFVAEPVRIDRSLLRFSDDINSNGA